MMKKADNLVSGKANLLCRLSLTTSAWSGGRRQNQVVVRFWIIANDAGGFINFEAEVTND